MNKLINTLKENEQDFEFYPTTDEIIKVVYNDLADMYGGRMSSFLDIGCGNGKIVSKIKEWGQIERAKRYKSQSEVVIYQPYYQISNFYGIEKSQILIKNLPDDVVILGTDFWQTQLIDKKVDVIFSNPPYSEFETWAEKIIKQGNAKRIYLVMPQRWESSKIIKEVLKLRKVGYQVIGNFDFLDAEDRKARAKIDIVKIDLQTRENPITDPFDIWFDETFKVNCDKTKFDSYNKSKKQKENLRQELVKGKNLIETMVEMYNKELGTILQTYKKLEELDAEILKELNVSLDNVKEGLKKRIHGLKDLFWQELFDRLDKITDRLTKSKRVKLLNTLGDQINIDFTESNIYAVVIWVIKNSNQYFDSQLTEIYLELTEPENVRNYKSNIKTWEKDNWRYSKKDHSHYCLDYRIIVNKYNSDELISDVCTIAKNLGFRLDYRDSVRNKTIIYMIDPNDNKKVTPFVEYRTFKNNNIHFKFNQNFMKAFNIEAARLLGWIHEPQDAVQEFPEECGVTQAEVELFFKKSYRAIMEMQQYLYSTSSEPPCK